MGGGAGTDWARGARVAERFELEALLGAGGHAEVWAARDVVAGGVVALKVQRRADAESRARLRREQRVSALVRHPAVVSVRESVELPDGRLALVLEHLRGEPLGALMEREGRLPAARVAALLAPIAGALAAAHDLGIVHRDVTPANVFVLEEGAEPPARILDFGSTKLTAADGHAAATAVLTRPGSALGTPLYMSPEQAFGEAVDARSDLWSLGVILYQSLSGRRPVDGSSLRQIYRVLLAGAFAPVEVVEPSVPAPIAAMVDRMLQPDPSARLADAREVERILNAQLRDGRSSAT